MEADSPMLSLETVNIYDVSMNVLMILNIGVALI
jgi:hypothetical protein